MVAFVTLVVVPAFVLAVAMLFITVIIRPPSTGIIVISRTAATTAPPISVVPTTFIPSVLVIALTCSLFILPLPLRLALDAFFQTPTP